MVIGLTLDEKKIPKTVDERVFLAKKIISFGRNYIPEEDIIIDPLISTISAEQDRALITLETVKKLKLLGIKTNLGVSNVSHGLPNRKSLNAAFLIMAIHYGLDLAIINPYEKEVMDAFYSSLVLNKIDKNATRYIRQMQGTHTTTKYETLDIKNKIINSIIYGDSLNVTEFIEEGVKSYPPLKINDFLLEGLDIVGIRYQKKELFLPQMIESAKAMKKGFKELKKYLPKKDQNTKGTILFATVKGDVHDIGKNIVITMFETNNYKVIDMGVDVTAKQVITAVHKHNPSLICLSALMTTTVSEMENIINLLKKEHLEIPVMIGGAVVNKEYAKMINAKYAEDALNALTKIKRILQ